MTQPQPSHRATFAQQISASAAAWKSESHLLQLIEFMCDLCETSVVNGFCTVLKPVESNDFRLAATIVDSSTFAPLTQRNAKQDSARSAYTPRIAGLHRSKTSPNLFGKAAAEQGRRTARESITVETIQQELRTFQHQMMQLTTVDISHLSSKLIQLLSAAGMQKLRAILLLKIRQRTSIQTLPDRLIVRIFGKLGVSDLRSCCRVCRRWNFVVGQSDLWKQKCNQLAAETGLLSYLATRSRKAKSNADYERIYVELEKVRDETVRIAARITQTERERSEMAERLKAARRNSSGTSLATYYTFTQTARDSEQAVPTAEQPTERTFEEFFNGNGEFQLPEWLIDRRPLMQTLIGMKKKYFQSSDIAVDTHRVLDLSKLIGAVYNPEVRDVLSCRVFTGHLQSVLCSAADRARLITGSADFTVRVWDKLSGATIRKLCGHGGPVTSVAFAEDFLCSASWDCTVQFWDLLKFQRVACVKQHSDVVTCVRIVQASRRSFENVLTAGYDGILHAHNLQTMTPQARIDYNRLEKVEGMAATLPTYRSTGDDDTPTERRFSPYGIIEMFVRNSQPALVYTAHADCNVRIADLRVGAPISRFSVFDNGLSIIPKPSAMAAEPGSGGWQALNVTGRQNASTIQNSVAVRAVAPNLDRGYLFYALTGTHVLAFDERMTGKPISTFCLERCSEDVQATAIVTTPKQHVMIGFSDGEIVEYDAMKMKQLRTLSGHKGAIRQMSLTKTSLFTCSDDYQARIWKLSKTAHGKDKKNRKDLQPDRSAFAVSSFYATLEKVLTTD